VSALIGFDRCEDAVLDAPPDTEQNRDVHARFLGTELLHVLNRWKAAHPDADAAAIRGHERELRFVRDAEHKAAVARIVEKFVNSLPNGLQVASPMPTQPVPSPAATNDAA
jgi:hypothetical protein